MGTCITATGGGSNFTGSQPISAAVAATNSGGFVYICPGSWADNVTISEPMTIEGAGQGSTTVLPYYSSANGYGDAPAASTEFDSTVFFVQANNVTIDNLTINGSNPTAVTSPSPWSAGVSCDNTFAAYGEDGGCGGVTFNAGAGIDTGNVSPGITGMVVQDVTVENVYNVGISDRSYDGTFEFTDDTVTDVGGYGGDGIFTFESNGTISDNTVSWSGEAIQTNWGAIDVTDNTISDSNWGVFMANNGEPAGYADGGSSTISGNTISSCWGQSFFGGAALGDSELGISFFAAFAPTPETVSDNDVTGCSTGLADFSTNNDEPNTYATPVVTFSNNTVNGQGLSGGIGALVSTDKLGYNNGPVDAQFTDNTITGFPTALYTDETNLDNWAQTNDSPLPGGLTVNASGNQFDGAWFNDATGPISAAGNYWGAPTGPSVAIGAPDGESSSALISRAASTWWTSPNEFPSAPGGVTATGGVRDATVDWTAAYPGNTDGSTPVTYTVTASPGGRTCSTATLSCSVSGLSNNTRYSFAVVATNHLGTGPSASASARTLTTPSAPRSVKARAGNNSVAVSWSAPASDGGSTITDYTVTSVPGTMTCKTATLSCTVHGLTNGTGYTFTVTATNAVGTGPMSAATSTRSPVAPANISPFGFGSSGLNNGLDKQIKALALSLKSDGNADVSLVGYTNPGEKGKSLPGLGLARAIAVKNYLGTLLNAEGLSGIKITESYGGNGTFGPNGSPLNRCVVATIS